jgi:hypothetical protein
MGADEPVQLALAWSAWQCLVKEARSVLNELWAKVSANDRMVLYGAVAVLVGWLFGQFFATVNLCGGILQGACNFSYFSAGDAGLFAILGLLAAIVTAVVIYLKVAPNVNISWPMPVVQVLLGLAAITLVCGVLVVLMQVRYGLGDAPIAMWIADVIFVGGGAVMTWAAYQSWNASK